MDGDHAVQPLDVAVSSAAGRLVALDTLRGVVILVMIFVNDIAGVKGMPWWCYHYDAVAGTPYDYNGYTLADWVFPAFLFAMGMSVPVALTGRAARGQRLSRTLGHIAIRSASLVLIGFFMVNASPDVRAAHLTPQQWNLLMFVCALLAFTTVPHRVSTYVMRGVGFAGLAVLAGLHLRYAGPMTPRGYWGILGLIGFSYAATALVWLLLGPARAALTAAVAMFIGLYMLQVEGRLDQWQIAGKKVIDGFAVGSVVGAHGAIAIAGAVMATILLPGSAIASLQARTRFILGFATLALLAAAVTYPLYHVSKNAGTPAWGLISVALSALLFLPLMWTEHSKWWWLFRVAGANALLIYLLQGLSHTVVQVAHINAYTRLGQSPSVAAVRGLALGVVLTLVAWGMSRARVRLRL